MGSGINVGKEDEGNRIQKWIHLHTSPGYVSYVARIGTEIVRLCFMNCVVGAGYIIDIFLADDREV